MGNVFLMIWAFFAQTQGINSQQASMYQSLYQSDRHVMYCETHSGGTAGLVAAINTFRTYEAKDWRIRSMAAGAYFIYNGEQNHDNAEINTGIHIYNAAKDKFKTTLALIAKTGHA